MRIIAQSMSPPDFRLSTFYSEEALVYRLISCSTCQQNQGPHHTRSTRPNGRAQCKRPIHSPQKAARESASRGKKDYDKRVRSSVLQAGDRVLVRNLTPRGGPGKLRNFWEDEIHVVARKGEGSPVYEVRPKSSKGRSRTLHRNLLLPCDYLPSKPWEELPHIKRYRPHTPHPRTNGEPTGTEQGQRRK